MGVIPGFLLQHAVTLEALLGQGPYGPRFDEADTVRCFLDEKRRLVRNREGREVTSEATFYARPDVTCPVGSRVTLPSGRITEVLAVAVRDPGTLPAPGHIEVSLT